MDYPTGLKVLAVDDDPLCLKVVERMLKRCRYDGEPPCPLSLEVHLLYCTHPHANPAMFRPQQLLWVAVYTAENGREALAKLREKDSQIDLVLSDVYMPGITTRYRWGWGISK